MFPYCLKKSSSTASCFWNLKWSTNETWNKAAVENIEHNPISKTAQGAFHGTGISLFQHPSADARGDEREVSNVDNTNKKRLAQLPAYYTNIQPLIFLKTEPPMPPLLGPFVRNCIEMSPAVVTGFKWLHYVRDCA